MTEASHQMAQLAAAGAQARISGIGTGVRISTDADGRHLPEDAWEIATRTKRHSGARTTPK